ncbi:MAG: Short-chain dehydrogenase, partial [Gammaproteobacteria bacterium]|nr:Short-chain dehydrogenase [Gammaproteobacteria bacterium]
MNARRLDGKVAIVTGAGRGIGRMEAHCLARAGAKLVVSDFGVDAGGTSTADIVAQEIRALGEEAVSSTENLMQQHGAAQVVATALRCFGG